MRGVFVCTLAIFSSFAHGGTKKFRGSKQSKIGGSSGVDTKLNEAFKSRASMHVIPVHSENSNTGFDVMERDLQVTPVQTYFVPFPEEDLINTFETVDSATSGDIQTLISIAFARDNTIIWYDHWEDGFEADITNPTQSTTLILGDGDVSNGAAPGVTQDADDILNAGRNVILENLVPVLDASSTVEFDGRDKIVASFPIAITRGAYPETPGSLLAGAVEVYDTDSWGVEYEVPVGPSTSSPTKAFDHTEIYVSASEDGTIVSFGLDTFPLEQGESINFLVDEGDVITSNRPVQAHLVLAEINAASGLGFEARWYALSPRESWSSEYFTSVGTASNSETVVWLYNPNDSPITVTSNIGGPYTIPAMQSVESDAIPVNQGGRFFAASGDAFYGIVQVDADCCNPEAPDGQVYDWGHPLIPSDQLTSQALIGWGYGCTNNDCTDRDGNDDSSKSVVFAMPTEDAIVCVDFDNDGYTEPRDVSYSLSALQGERISDDGTGGDEDMSGALIYAIGDGTCSEPGTPVDIAVAWGQDSTRVTELNDQPISLDLGTVIVPLPEIEASKTATLEDTDNDGEVNPGDVLVYSILIQNALRTQIEAGAYFVRDVLPTGTSYVTSSTFYNSGDGPTPVADNTVGTPFVLDGEGLSLQATLLPSVPHTITFKVRIDTIDALPDLLEVINVGDIYPAGKPDEPVDTFRTPTPLVFQASVSIDNLAVAGPMGDCADAVDLLYVNPATTVTYCFTITNTGGTFLDTFDLTNAILEGRGASFGSSPPEILAPGESFLVTMEDNIDPDKFLENIANVTAVPTYASGEPIPVLDVVFDDDESAVEVVDPAISIDNTVYIGDDNGASCPGDDVVIGLYGETATFCLIVTNNGDIPLVDVEINDPVLGVVLTIPALGVGESSPFHVEDILTTDELNTATASGTPAFANLTAIPNIPPVEDSDDSEVKVLTLDPTHAPTNEPTMSPSETPSEAPSVSPSNSPSEAPTEDPTDSPSEPPSMAPSESPSAAPSKSPSEAPSEAPTEFPSESPSMAPSESPSAAPSDGPTPLPTSSPTLSPTASSPAISIDNTVYASQNGGSTCPGVEKITNMHGTEITYCFVITNTGDSFLTDLVIENPVLVELGGFIEGTVPDVLAPGESFTVFTEDLLTDDLINTAVVTGTPSKADGTTLDVPDVTDNDDSEVEVITSSPTFAPTNEPTAPPSPLCVDSAEPVYIYTQSALTQDCSWLAARNDREIGYNCARNDRLPELCPLTCGVCNLLDTCNDFTFNFNPWIEREEDCDFIAGTQFRVDTFCNSDRSNADVECPLTCGTCLVPPVEQQICALAVFVSCTVDGTGEDCATAAATFKDTVASPDDCNVQVRFDFSILNSDVSRGINSFAISVDGFFLDATNDLSSTETPATYTLAQSFDFCTGRDIVVQAEANSALDCEAEAEYVIRIPTESPTMAPSARPSVAPTEGPSESPSAAPSIAPTTVSPTSSPTSTPSDKPSAAPSDAPSKGPTVTPTAHPTPLPRDPTMAPTFPLPTSAPSAFPTIAPTDAPTESPSSIPSAAPSIPPTALPICDIEVAVNCTMNMTQTPTISGDGECLDRATEMSFKFIGGTCTANANNDQDGKYECMDYLGGPAESGSASIRITGKDADTVYFVGDVTVGDTIVLDTEGERVDADMTVTVRRVDDGEILQRFQFHSSCSRNLFLNDVFGVLQLVSFTNEEQGTLTSADGAAEEQDSGDKMMSCDAIEPLPTLICEKRATQMSFRYNGGDCSQTNNFQEGKAECTDETSNGPPTTGSAFLTITSEKDSDTVYFDGLVQVGEVFDLVTGGESVDADMRVVVKRDGVLEQTVVFHSSCSKNLFLLDKFGSVELVAFTNKPQGYVTAEREVTYTYTVKNTGNYKAEDIAITAVRNGKTVEVLTDGTINVDGELVVSESVFVPLSGDFDLSTTADVLALTETSGVECSANDTLSIELPTPPAVPVECEERPTEMSFEFIGGDCNQNSNKQDGKYECEDFAAGPMSTEAGAIAHIHVHSKNGDEDYFKGNVAVGDVFALNTGGDRVEADMKVVIRNGDSDLIQRFYFHSSCSQNLFLNDIFGGLRLAGFTNSEQGNVGVSP